MAGSDALKRIGGGRWETRDGRFQIEPQSGTWVIVDTTQTNEFGLPLVRGPFGSLGAAKDAIEEARIEGPAEGCEAVEGRSSRLPEGIESAGRCHRRRRRLGQAARARTRAEARPDLVP